MKRIERFLVLVSRMDCDLFTMNKAYKDLGYFSGNRL